MGIVRDGVIFLYSVVFDKLINFQCYFFIYVYVKNYNLIYCVRIIKKRIEQEGFVSRRVLEKRGEEESVEWGKNLYNLVINE